MSTSSEPLAYTVKEAAKLCGLSSDMIYELCRQDIFPHLRVGARKIIIPKRRLEAWLNGSVMYEPVLGGVESAIRDGKGA